MSFELDPRFTFEAFVVGPANRMAVAAARRVAESPGSTYNPLFLYSASGLGKTHLLTAIGHHARGLHEAPVMFETVEHLIDEFSNAVEAGEGKVFRDRLQDTSMLLLDDIQFAAGLRQVQEDLIRVWDSLSARGAQVVLTSDRPPQEIDGLDRRLLSRLSGGLIVDISPPDYETRVAIARRKAEERGRPLSPEVCQAVGRIAFTNVRELQGALNRLIAVQELEGRMVGPEEVVSLLGVAAERGEDEFGEFLLDITGTVSTAVGEADRHVADAILAWEGEGYRTRRLELGLGGGPTAGQAEELIRRFEQDVARLRAIEDEIRSLEPEAPELESEALRDPDRVAEAEALRVAVRGRLAPPPPPPEGPGLDAVKAQGLAYRAARVVAEAPGQVYNPLYIMGAPGTGKSALMAALGNTIGSTTDLAVGYLTADTFTTSLIEALEHSRLDAWRAQLRRADVLLLDDLDRFADTERAQEELFHLFEELTRTGRQLVFAAEAAPHALDVPDRLRSRLEGGLVVELGVERPRAPGTLEIDFELELVEEFKPDPELEEDADDEAAVARPVARGDAGNRVRRRRIGPEDHWIQSREKVLWEWPYPGDWIQESLD